MRTIFAITATGTLFLSGIAWAGELPSYEVSGFPITPHQIAVLGATGSLKEKQSPSTSLVVGGMPASPVQLSILAPRQSAVPKLATAAPATP